MARIAKPNVADPDARPSSPSVRFTALEVPTITKTAHTTHPTLPRFTPIES